MAGNEEAFVLSAIGTTVGVSLAGATADLAAQLRSLWSRCLTEPESTPESLTIELLAPDATPSRTETHVADHDLDRLLTAATQLITQAFICAQAGKLLLLHAGAVCHPETGKSLVFVAPGGTGKTTLTRTLGTRYGYLTDETVAIDRDLRILAYPKPLSIRDQPGTAKTEHSPDALGLLDAHADPQLARLVLLDREDGHDHSPTVTELNLLDAIVELAAQTSSLHLLPHGLQRIAELVAATGPILKVRYAEAESLTGLVAGWIGAPR